MPLTIGARSPFAISELIEGGPINWRREANPLGKIEALLGATADEIFNPAGARSWLYAPPGTPHPWKLEIVPWLRRQLLLMFAKDRFPAGQPLAVRRHWAWDKVFKSTDSGGFKWKAAPPLDPDRNAQSREIQQGHLANCYLVAALAAVGWWDRERLVNEKWIVVSPSAGDPPRATATLSYSTPPKSVTVDTLLPHTGAAETLIYAQTRADLKAPEGWPGLWEKGWILHLDKNANSSKPEYRSLEFRDPVEALQALADEKVAVWKLYSGDAWVQLRENCPGADGEIKTAAVTWTKQTKADNPSLFDECKYMISINHAYTVLGCIGTKGNELLVMRDPWAHSFGSPQKKLEAAQVALREHSAQWKKISEDDGGVFAVPREIAEELFDSWASWPYKSP